MPTQKIGLLVPDVNSVIEPDMYKMAPPGITVHSARMTLPGGDADNALEMVEKHMLKAVAELLPAHVKVLAFGATAPSLVKGVGWDMEMIKRIEVASGLPATTTSTAVVEALHALGLRTIGVATPYQDSVNKNVIRFLTGNGFEVLSLEGYSWADRAAEIADQPPETAYESGLKADRKEADGVFVSCTNWRALEIVDRLEEKIGKPVVTSNQATMWAILLKIGFKGSILGFGKLLRDLI